VSSYVCVTFEYGIFLFEHDQTFVLIIYSISLNVFYCFCLGNRYINFISEVYAFGYVLLPLLKTLTLIKPYKNV